MKAIRAPLYLAGALLLTGCAITVYESKYDWSEGWRKAEVVAVQMAAEMERPRFYTCVRTATPEQLASTRFAVVKYKQISRTQRRAVPLQPIDKIASGDVVYVKVDNCTSPIAATSSNSRRKAYTEMEEGPQLAPGPNNEESS